MKALIYHGPGTKSWDDVPNPRIVDETDAIVQVDTTTICSTDLHILKGVVPRSGLRGDRQPAAVPGVVGPAADAADEQHRYFGRPWTWFSSICQPWPGQDLDLSSSTLNGTFCSLGFQRSLQHLSFRELRMPVPKDRPRPGPGAQWNREVAS